ncbi:unnamed protein product [Acanthosepion pharaonis]|uniref:Helitron helicase-like domain-containing protein n=1 Tax=Acanthosepion pharaonis TaxID=158019 RepID=A0A812BZF6_ACAPH|nr:unnamed protein product [Sepia pharaonis]
MTDPAALLSVPKYHGEATLAGVLKEHLRQRESGRRKPRARIEKLLAMQPRPLQLPFTGPRQPQLRKPHVTQRNLRQRTFVGPRNPYLRKADTKAVEGPTVRLERLQTVNQRRSFEAFRSQRPRNRIHVCLYCNAKKWPGESAGLCCSDGKVQLPPFQELPASLKALLEGSSPDSKHFLAKIRQYNSAFQMTSFGGNAFREVGWNPTFKVQGQVYYRIGPLLPETATDSAFLQIYFIADYNQQADARMCIIPENDTGQDNHPRRDIIMSLQQMLHETNSYVCSLIDMAAMMESEKLCYIKVNQTKLRCYSYIHLRDALRNDADPRNMGKMCILPATFTGSPRYMHARTQDAMTYVRKYGRPDLFITFTCNPKWYAIAKELMPGQSDYDRPDLIARWQKGGLPHAHILICLCDKIEATETDHLISAVIPDPLADPELYEIVTTNMIHGPCGSHCNYTSFHNSDGKCTRQYPQDFLGETITGSDGYPLYRRRSPAEGGFTGVFAPSSMYASTSNKGTDAAMFGIRQEGSVDEIQDFLAGRVISRTEGPWHIFSFPIHERFPAIVQLAVHLENDELRYLSADTAMDVAARTKDTAVTAFFKLCRQDEFARTLLYPDVPSYYVWTAGLGGSARPTSRSIQASKKTPHSEGYSQFPHRDRNVFACDSFCTKLVVQPATITYGRLMEFYGTLFVRPASISAFWKTTASGMPQWLRELF